MSPILQCKPFLTPLRKYFQAAHHVFISKHYVKLQSMLIAPLTLHTSRGLHAITAYHRLYSTGELETTP